MLSIVRLTASKKEGLSWQEFGRVRLQENVGADRLRKPTDPCNEVLDAKSSRHFRRQGLGTFAAM
jgi:hypothetical protein